MQCECFYFTSLDKHTQTFPPFQICPKTFKDNSSLRRHSAIHAGAERKRLECELCKKAFSDRSTFVRHQKERHHRPEEDEEGDELLLEAGGGKEKEKKKKGRSATAPAACSGGVLRFGCNICKKGFKRRITMATHVTRVHGILVQMPGDKNPEAEGKQPIEKFLMANADKAKKAPSSKAEDLKKSSEEAAAGVGSLSDLKCPQCDMIFYKRSAMEVHMRVHSGEKPYFCDVRMN